ncbi:cytochrome b-245 light chain-like isoform X2 [Dendronephthya gigantea]|uniref:cytochrome b-245 light chain-like isoform X2 n=1 Tax=Dendronephthya gigantea TaxID=151771 RepID=UPI00106BE100|nr:cytochrome b-245 light chain-like isoform X2 [Dendronephthya gigantea]
MGKIEWAMWANEQAVASSVVLFVGGVLSWIGKFKKWEIGVYAVFAAILIILIEYPRAKRQTGRTKERIAQKFLTPVIKSLGPFGRNYYVRFLLYLGLSIPCGFLLSTLLGGACLCISSIIYLVAAVAGEEWKPCIVTYEAKQENTLPEAPQQPPPRLHQVSRSSENLYENA